MKNLIVVLSILTGLRMMAEDNSRKIIWGNETNNIRAGLISEGGDYTHRRAECEIWLESSTNATLPFVIPDVPYQYELALFDAKGNAVAKTNVGESIGRALPDLEKRNGTIDGFPRVRRIYLKPSEPELLLTTNLNGKSFNLFDYFQITTPGEYKLQFQQRLQVALTPYSFKRLVLPDVTVELEIK